MPMPCDFDHNGECLVCDGWPTECAWVMLMDRNFTSISEKKLVEMLLPYMNDAERIKLSITMGKIEAPFTPEQVRKLEQWQGLAKDNVINEPVHPFTCCSHNGCERNKREDQGVLIPTLLGWTCPCGE